jgi:hypothetical protein
MNERRITVDDARAAYLATGLVPTSQVFIEDGCGCPEYALFLQAHGRKCEKVYDESLEGDCAAMWADEQYGEQYAQGFRDGFDGNQLSGDSVPERIRVGHADGVAVAVALLDPQTAEGGPF